MFDLINRCSGLITQYNPIEVPPGALSQADNCVIRRENVIEDRRGYASYGSISNNPVELLVYSSKVLCHNGTTLSYDNGSGTFNPYAGTYSAPSGQKMRGVETWSNLYITTSTGIQVITDTAGTAARNAGVPRAIDLTYVLTGSSGFLASNTQCAYRVIYVRTDANGNVLLGYPSQRLWVANTGTGSVNVNLTVYLNGEIAVADAPQYQVQIYRTQTVAYASASGDQAGDNEYLVYQYTVQAADVTNGYIPVVTDSLIDTLALSNTPLYTNATEEGIEQANDRPPYCNDATLYKSNYLFFANCKTKQRLFFTMVGTSGLTGNTITLQGITYSFGTTEISSGAGAPQAKVSATGVVALDIQLTAQSLVRVINRYASNTTLNAFYESDPSSLPGAILVEERVLGGSAYSLTASNATIQGMFSPQPPTSGTTTQSTSSNQVQKNAIYFSKYQEFEAVPTLNYLLVGPANKAVLRIEPLRNSLVIIKEEGVYLLTGDTPTAFVIIPLDLTVYCKSADSVAALSNQVFMLSNQGVVTISETGVAVVSRAIEPNILPLLSFSGISTYATGCAYESERSYILSVMSASTDTSQNQIYLYNIFTQTWVHWTFGFNAATVEPTSDQLYFTKPGVQTVYKERKSFSNSDYADPESTITITSISGSTVIFNLPGTTPAVGWSISQNGTSIPILTLVANSGTYTATMAASPPGTWVTGAATIYPSVGMVVVWDDWAGPQGGGLLKQVREFAALSDNTGQNSTATTVTLTFTSNFDSSQDQIVYSVSGNGWGASWGSIPWGGDGDSFGYRTYVPRNKQRCRVLNPGVIHAGALEKLSLVGCAFTFDYLGERIGR